MKKLLLAFAVAVGGTLACVTFRDSVEDKLPLTVIRVLRSPDSLEILALDPVPVAARRADARTLPIEKEFHGYEILGHAPLNDDVVRQELVELVLRGIQESDGRVAACFDPRHGIRAVKEGKVLDMLICYECLQVEIHYSELVEEKGRLGVLTANTVEPDVTRIYRSAGLAIAPK